MPSLEPQDKLVVEYLLKDGFSIQEVLDIVLHRGGHGSRTAIYRIAKRFKETGTVKPCVGGRPKLISTAMRDYMLDFLSEKHAEGSKKKPTHWRREIQECLQLDFNAEVSEVTIIRCLKSEDFEKRLEERIAGPHNQAEQGAQGAAGAQEGLNEPRDEERTAVVQPMGTAPTAVHPTMSFMDPRLQSNASAPPFYTSPQDAWEQAGFQVLTRELV